MEISELMPLQARIADRFSIVRGFQTTGSHDSRMLTTGFRPGLYRPAFGSVVSKLRPLGLEAGNDLPGVHAGLDRHARPKAMAPGKSPKKPAIQRQAFDLFCVR
jgi:hypothetical protein